MRRDNPGNLGIGLSYRRTCSLGLCHYASG